VRQTREHKTFYQIHERLYLSSFILQPQIMDAYKMGITAVVNLVPFKLYDPIPEIKFWNKGFKDGIYIPQEILEEIFAFIDENIKYGKVLVHCAAGVSRSGGIVVGRLLIENPNWIWEDALNYIRKIRYIMPAPNIKKSILDFLEKKEQHRRE